MNNLDKRILEITKVYDNNGETYDRYTVFTPDGAVYGMSEGGEGFNQYIGDYTEVEMGEHLGTKLDSVPESIKSPVLNRMVDSQFVDLFQYYELMPENVSATFNMYYEMNDNEWSYDSLSKLQSELKELGYTFDYGLDAEPYGLRPIELSLNQLKDFEEYKNGGSIYNKGRSWHLDRQKHNKSESWEKPMRKRKKRYATGGGLDKFMIGDLVFAKDEGMNGLVGLVISDARKNEDGVMEYDILYRGYSGDIIPTAENDIVDIRQGYMDIAQNKSDISSYTSIAEKRGITINPVYQQVIDEEYEYKNGGGVGKSKSYLHLYKLTYPNGQYRVEAYDGEAMTPKEALEKMRISLRGLKSYKYSGASNDSENYKKWYDKKDIGYSDTEAWDEVFGSQKYANGGGVGKMYLISYTDENGYEVKKKVSVDELKLLTPIVNYTIIKEYSKGGGINSGRDNLFKSQEPHEQRYKRKREWKEYKKEGWFGDWFRDGGSMDDYNKSLGMVRVKFADSKYNYKTNVSGSITEEQARNYFVGKMFDVGTYPNENMQKAIDIDFYEKGTYENGGGVGNFSEYSNDALTDAIINLSRFENTEDDIQTLKEELKKRKESIKLDSEEEMVKSNLYNGEISCEKLTEIIGCNPNYPYQIVGAIKLEKCYLRPYYKLV